MKHPWANGFILALAAASLVTGYVALAAGRPDQAWLLHLHRAAGYSIAALLVWKGRNIVAPLVRRWRRLGIQDLAAAGMLGLLLANLGLGIAWAHAGMFSFAGFSGVSWHINIAWLLLPLLLWHLVRYRRLLRPRYWAERRSFLRLMGLAGAGLVMWQIGSTVNRALALPSSGRRFTGSYPAGDFTGNAFPTTSWLNDRPAPIDRELWRIEVRGAVRNQLDLAYEDLEAADELVANLDCTGGWHSTQAWGGTRLGRLLDLAQPTTEAASVSVASVTGYYRRFSLPEAGRLLLATHVEDEPINHAHGAPMRLVVPDARGFAWVKWVTRVEVHRTGKWLQPPLPLQ